jgi:hypothetical protein
MPHSHPASDRSSSAVAPPSQQPRCPYCHSAEVIVPAKPSPSAYLRCESCGQLWHPDRLSSRAGGRR